MEKYYRELNPTGLRFGIGNSYSFPPHIHEDVELMCITEGVHIACVDGKRYVLNQGDFLLICPNQVHSFERANENNLHFTMIIKPVLLGSWGEFLSQNVPTRSVWSGAIESPPWKLLMLSYEEYCKNGEQEILYTLLTALFAMIGREMDFEKEPTAGEQSIRKILQYCALHFREEISVKDLAKAVFLSQSHVSHIFSDKLKISFPDYINSLRVAEAARYLESGQHTISEAAGLSGFTTIRTFNRVFKKRYGMTPQEYRRQKSKN